MSNAPEYYCPHPQEGIMKIHATSAEGLPVVVICCGPCVDQFESTGCLETKIVQSEGDNVER